MQDKTIDRSASARPFAKLPEPAQTGAWIAMVIAASLLFSWALACATPFAALAAIAALTLSRRHALLLVGAVFLINQAIGYLLLDYPRDWQSYGWGIAIGAAAFAATFAAAAAGRVTGSLLAGLAAAFAGAFVAYELVLIAATVALPAGGGFSLSVINQIFWINALAFLGLLVLQRLAAASGLSAGKGASLAALQG